MPVLHYCLMTIYFPLSIMTTFLLLLGEGYMLFAIMTSNTLSKHFVILFTNLSVGFLGLAILALVTNNVHKVVKGGQFPAISILSLMAGNCLP